MLRAVGRCRSYPLVLAFATPNSVHWDIDVALAEGFFTAAGFTPSVVVPQSSPQAVQLLVGGGVDLAAVQPEAMLAAVSHGAAAIAAATQPESRPDWLLIGAKSIRSWSDLKGTTLGVSALRVAEF